MINPTQTNTTHRPAFFASPTLPFLPRNNHKPTRHIRPFVIPVAWRCVGVRVLHIRLLVHRLNRKPRIKQPIKNIAHIVPKLDPPILPLLDPLAVGRADIIHLPIPLDKSRGRIRVGDTVGPVQPQHSRDLLHSPPFRLSFVAKYLFHLAQQSQGVGAILLPGQWIDRAANVVHQSHSPHPFDRLWYHYSLIHCQM